MREALRHLRRSKRHALDVWIYLAAVVGGEQEREIAARLERHGPLPARAAHWSREIVRQRIRYARRELRSRLGLDEARLYGRQRVRRATGGAARVRHRALRIEAARLDAMVMEALRRLG